MAVTTTVATTTTDTTTSTRSQCTCITCQLPICTCDIDVCESDVGHDATIQSSSVESQIIEDILVDSISCGEPELAVILRESVADAFCISPGCSQHIRFLNAQLHLIDIAMFYVRNRVDEFKSRAESEGSDQFDSQSRAESKAQRTSQTTSCGFEDQTSFQQFQRDSVDRFRSQSDTSAFSVGSSLTNRTDRSQTAASGYSAIVDFAQSLTTGRGNGQHIATTNSDSKSYSKTGNAGPGLNDLNTGAPSFQIPDYDFSNVVQGSFTEGITINPPTVTSPLITDSVSGQYSNPGAIPAPPCPPLSCGGADYDTTEALPSYGRGYNVTYNMSISVPSFGATRVDWGTGASFRQQHLLTQRCSSSFNTGNSFNIYDQTDQSVSEGETDIHDESSTNRNIVTVGDSFRDAQSNTTAGSATTGDAHSESHSGSDRMQHSEGQGSNQGTAFSQSRSTANSITQNKSTSQAQGRKFSQIFDALSDMWSMVFEEVQFAQNELNANLGPRIHKIVGTGCVAVPPDPILLRSPGISRYFNGCRTS